MSRLGRINRAFYLQGITNNSQTHQESFIPGEEEGVTRGRKAGQGPTGTQGPQIGVRQALGLDLLWQDTGVGGGSQASTWRGRAGDVKERDTPPHTHTAQRAGHGLYSGCPAPHSHAV